MHMHHEGDALSIATESGDNGGAAGRAVPRARPQRARGGRRPSGGRPRRRGPAPHAFGPALWLVVVCLASNRMATRVLQSLFVDDARGDGGAAPREGAAAAAGGRSLRSAGSEAGRGPLDLVPRSDGAIRNDEWVRPKPGPPPSVAAVVAVAERTEEGTEGVTREVTRRFASLRGRLLSLYAERVPSDSDAANASDAPHPLYDRRSAQYRALDWLAHVDGLRLRHSDAHLVQRFVLAVAYFATGGPPVAAGTDLARRRRGPWRHPTNFLAPTHECEWKSQIQDGAGRGGGIRRCDRNGTVVEISLYNELTGPIPSELGRLWNLRTLYLGRNRLTGTVPSELGMIQKLSSLSLQWNDLSGTLPGRHLQHLRQLRALQVEGNEKLRGTIDRHSLLCQMRNKYRGPTPRGRDKYAGRRLLRLLTATCVPPGGGAGAPDRLECACCTECFGKTRRDLIYHA